MKATSTFLLFGFVLGTYQLGLPPENNADLKVEQAETKQKYSYLI